MRTFAALLRFWLLLLGLWSGPAVAGQVQIGDRLPSLSLVDWKGAPYPLDGDRGSAVVIDFWATWCVVCKQALPSINALVQRHAGQLRVLAVNIDADRSRAEQWVAEHLPEPRMTMLHDPGGAAFAGFGAAGMPALYLIDGSGVVRLVEAGYRADAVADIEARIVPWLRPAPSAVNANAGAARPD